MVAIKSYYTRARAYTASSSLADLLIALVLIAAGLKFTANLEHVIDVKLWDEASVMYNGLRLFDLGVPDPQYSPLYSIWYWALSFLVKEPITLYFFNYKIVTIVLSLVLFVCLRTQSIHRLIAAAIANYVLISMANLEVWPKTIHFLAICILISIILTIHIKNRVTLFSSLSLCALICSYIRPEMFVSYILFIILLGGVLIKDRAHTLPSMYMRATACAVLIPAIWIAIFGFPLNGTRSRDAFCQHFALNWTHWENSTIDPWTHCEEISRANFGDTNTIVGMAASNFPVFERHILTNLSNIGLAFFNLFALHFNIFLPSTSIDSDILEGWIVLLAITLAILAYCYLRRHIIAKHLDLKNRLFLICAVFTAPFLASIVLIYPRDHYILNIGIALIIVVATLLFKRPSQEGSSIYGILAFGIIAVLITPSFANGWRYGNHKPEENANINTIRFIQSLGIHSDMNILESDGGYIYFLDRNFHWVPGYIKQAGFNDMIRDHSVQMIVVGQKLAADARFADDPEWKEFLEHYQAQGFQKRDIPNSGRVMFIAGRALQ